MKALAKARPSTPIRVKTEHKYFLFYCPELDVWSVGKSREEAERNLKEDLDLLLRRCSRYNPLDKVLSNCCFTAVEIRA